MTSMEKTARFEDAIRWVLNGGFARRKVWASVTDYTRSTPPLGVSRRWHIWRTDNDDIIAGWGGSIGATENGDPVRDGMLYAPTDEDRTAHDWELYQCG
jgi:hypothetical protein